MENIKVLIGIQTRTNSTRLPNKAMKKIQGVTVTDHVINAVQKSAQYINRFSGRTGVKTDVWAVVPLGDPLAEYLSDRENLTVFQGPEKDLIQRYKGIMDLTNADYLVRITGDCPLIPPFLITKSINSAVKNQYDFFENADPQYRTFFDGADVEVVSRKAFDWLFENAKEREHVFQDLRSDPPDWMTFGFCFNYVDFSFLKLSIDTEKDFELVKNQYASVKSKRRKWEEIHGKGSSHAF